MSEFPEKTDLMENILMGPHTTDYFLADMCHLSKLKKVLVNTG